MWVYGQYIRLILEHIQDNGTVGYFSLNAVHSYGKMHKFRPCYENIFIGTMFGKTKHGIRCFAQKVFFFFFFQGVLPGKIGFYVTESPAIF